MLTFQQVFKYIFLNHLLTVFLSGTIVLWNVTDLESSNLLNFLRQYEEDSYSERLIQAECEIMKYKYSQSEK